MTCPDGTTFAKTLSDCPKTTEPPPSPTPIPEPAPTKCPDGSYVPAGRACPLVQCADSSFVADPTQCPPTTKETTLTDEQLKQVEKERTRLTKELNILEKTFVATKDSASLQKVIVLKASLAALALHPKTVFEDLQTIADGVTVLLVLTEEDGEIDEEERDAALKKQALLTLKLALPATKSSITLLNQRIKKDEKKGVTIPAGLKEKTAAALRLLKIMQAADVYEEARDAADALQEHIAEINQLLPLLETAERLRLYAPFLKRVGREITQRTQKINTLRALNDRRNLQLEDILTKTQEELNVVAAALEEAKRGAFGNSEPGDFLEENVNIPLEDIDDAIESITALLNIRAFVNQADTKLRQYDARMKRMKRQKKDIPKEIVELLEKTKEENAALRAISRKKVTGETAKETVALLESVTDALDHLGTFFAGTATSPLQKELRKYDVKQDPFKAIETPTLDQVARRARHIASFFHHEGVGLKYFSFLKPQKRPPNMSLLAIDARY